METIISALANAVIDTLWLAALTPFVTRGRRLPAAPVESPLVAESNADLAEFVAGRTTFAEFTTRNNARLVAIKSKV